MSLLKYKELIERIKSIHHLIENEKTGTSEEFAENVGISRSMLMEHLREMREVFNAPIDYCRKRQTFYYASPFQLNIMVPAAMNMVKGGTGRQYPSLYDEDAWSVRHMLRRWLAMR